MTARVLKQLHLCLWGFLFLCPLHQKLLHFVTSRITFGLPWTGMRKCFQARPLSRLCSIIIDFRATELQKFAAVTTRNSCSHQNPVSPPPTALGKSYRLLTGHLRVEWNQIYNEGIAKITVSKVGRRESEHSQATFFLFCPSVIQKHTNPTMHQALHVHS